MIGINIVENMQMAEVTSKSIYNTFFQLRSRIQSTQSRFKLIKFDNNKKKQVRKLVEYGNIMANIANILVVENNNCFFLKNNVEYA